jgi:hypothetical protein
MYAYLHMKNIVTLMAFEEGGEEHGERKITGILTL